MSQAALSARTAFQDCLTFFEQSIQPMLKQAYKQSPVPGEMTGEATVVGTYDIRFTVPHEALVFLVNRYPDASFDFQTERARLPGVSKSHIKREPLLSQYTTFTIDFEAYGVAPAFGGGDGDGGSKVETDSTTTGENTSPTQPAGPTSPGGPTGPGNANTTAEGIA